MGLIPALKETLVLYLKTSSEVELILVVIERQSLQVEVFLVGFDMHAYHGGRNCSGLR